MARCPLFLFATCVLFALGLARGATIDVSLSGGGLKAQISALATLSALKANDIAFDGIHTVSGSNFGVALYDQMDQDADAAFAAYIKRHGQNDKLGELNSMPLVGDVSENWKANIVQKFLKLPPDGKIPAQGKDGPRPFPSLQPNRFHYFDRCEPSGTFYYWSYKGNCRVNSEKFECCKYDDFASKEASCATASPRDIQKGDTVASRLDYIVLSSSAYTSERRYATVGPSAPSIKTSSTGPLEYYCDSGLSCNCPLAIFDNKKLLMVDFSGWSVNIGMSTSLNLDSPLGSFYYLVNCLVGYVQKFDIVVTDKATGREVMKSFRTNNARRTPSINSLKNYDLSPSMADPSDPNPNALVGNIMKYYEKAVGNFPGDGQLLKDLPYVHWRLQSDKLKLDKEIFYIPFKGRDDGASQVWDSMMTQEFQVISVSAAGGSVPYTQLQGSNLFRLIKANVNSLAPEIKAFAAATA